LLAGLQKSFVKNALAIRMSSKRLIARLTEKSRRKRGTGGLHTGSKRRFEKGIFLKKKRNEQKRKNIQWGGDERFRRVRPKGTSGGKLPEKRTEIGNGSVDRDICSKRKEG